MSDSMEGRPSSEVTDEEDLMFEDELGDLEFADNPEPRCPVLIIADCSGSMSGRPIDAMNQGVDDLYRAVIVDEIARNRVEVALLSFSTEARVERDFGTVTDEGRTRLAARGATNMHLAVQQGCDLLEERKEQYRRNGVPTSGPLWFCSAMGCPPAPETKWRPPTSGWWTWKMKAG